MSLVTNLIFLTTKNIISSLLSPEYRNNFLDYKEHTKI